MRIEVNIVDRVHAQRYIVCEEEDIVYSRQSTAVVPNLWVMTLTWVIRCFVWVMGQCLKEMLACYIHSLIHIYYLGYKFSDNEIQNNLFIGSRYIFKLENYQKRVAMKKVRNHWATNYIL